MAIKGIGINAHGGRLDGNLELLEHDLACFQRAGFDYVEMPVHGVDAILNGRLNLRQMKRVREAFAKFPRLKYTVHCSNWLNLMDAEEFQLHRSIFEASIDFASEIEAEILVYHCGRVELGNEYLGQAAFTRELLSIPDRTFVEERERVERETLAELAEGAESKGVTICMENADPRVDEEAVWELARRVRGNGIDLFHHIAPGGDIALYNYGGVIEHLVRQAEGVGRDNVGITLDIGHAYIASNYYGFDFLDAITLAKPLVRHIHIHDNFGRPAGLDRRQIILIAEGKGDLHMPVGWGEIPYREVFSRLKGYEGIILLELKPRYKAYLEDALLGVRSLLEECGVA